MATALKEPRVQGTPPLPWVVTLTAVTALAAFGVFRREGLFAALVAIMFFAPNALSLRFSGGAARALLSLIAYGIAGAASFAEQEPVGGQTVYGDIVQTLSRFVVAELAVQNWLAPRNGDRFSRQAIILLLSCITFAAASKTFDVSRIFIYFALPFFVFLALSFRQLRERSFAPVQPRFALRAWTHWAALLLALGVGFSLSGTVQANKRALAQLGLAGIVTPTAPPPQVVSYSSTPVLGPRQNVTRSTQRVLFVAGELPEGGHLRGMSFDLYNRGRWDPPGDMRTFEVLSDRPSEIGLQNVTSCTITRLTDDIPLLFLPLNTVTFTAPGAPSYQRDRRYRDVFQVYEPPPFQYTAIYGTSSDGALLTRAPGEALKRRLLWTPDDMDPGVLWLAKELTGRLRDPLEKIRAVETYLRTNHSYSLEIQPGPGDPVADFILHKRAGHCEFFASSAAMLLRYAGIPTRYVTGFAVHERSGEGWVVRQQDAHAWAESHVPGKGWITVDATPAAGLPANNAEKVPFWRRWLERLGDLGLALWARIKTWGAVEWSLAAGAVLAMGLLVLIIRWKRLRKRIAPPREYVIPGKFLPAAAREMERRLAELSVPCPPSVTWQEHLKELLSRSDPPASRKALEAAAEFARKYSALRFGAPENEEQSEALLVKRR